MIDQTFYHSLVKKHIIVFGALFKDIYINRVNANNIAVQGMQVPLRYGPKEKFLARLNSDPQLNRPAVQLPIMGYECTNIQYAPDRKLNTVNRQISSTLANGGRAKFVYSPVPYDFAFRLSVMVKNIDDGQQIIEQILPYFTPDFTVKTQLLTEIPIWQEIPIVLQGVQSTDTYAANFQERRALIWDLTFNMRGYLYGPVRDQPLIRTATINVNQIGTNGFFETVTITPGLTANGQPTTNAAATIPPIQIKPTDPYDYIVDINEEIQN